MTIDKNQAFIPNTTFPFSVRIYFCFGLFGLSIRVGDTNPDSIKMFNILFLNLVLFFSPTTSIKSVMGLALAAMDFRRLPASL